MHADVVGKVPEFQATVVAGAYEHVVGEHLQFGDVGGVFSWQISDQLTCEDIPHLD